MNTLTVGMLRDLLNTIPADTPVMVSMDMDGMDTADAVYLNNGAVVFDNVTAGLNGVGGSVLFNANA